jgi:hypothetical protein
MATGTMHTAKVETSQRLQRVLAVLDRGGWWSTRGIMYAAHVCAVNSCVAELRANGYRIETRVVTHGAYRHYAYRLVAEGAA